MPALLLCGDRIKVVSSSKYLRKNVGKNITSRIVNTTTTLANPWSVFCPHCSRIPLPCPVKLIKITKTFHIMCAENTQEKNRLSSLLFFAFMHFCVKVCCWFDNKPVFTRCRRDLASPSLEIRLPYKLEAIGFCSQ